MATCCVLPALSKPVATVRPFKIVFKNHVTNNDLDRLQQLQTMDTRRSRTSDATNISAGRSPPVVARIICREGTVRPVQPVLGIKRCSFSETTPEGQPILRNDIQNLNRLEDDDSIVASSRQTPDPLLAAVYARLTHCRFYFKNMSHSQAKVRLRSAEVGTFLIRDSSDPEFRFTLSVRTSRGTTSIRIARTLSGQFQLDCEGDDVQLMPAFDCVLDLCQHYQVSHQQRNSGGSSCVFLEKSGRMDTPVMLTKSLDDGILPVVVET